MYSANAGSDVCKAASVITPLLWLSLRKGDVLP